MRCRLCVRWASWCCRAPSPPGSPAGVSPTPFWRPRCRRASMPCRTCWCRARTRTWTRSRSPCSIRPSCSSPRSSPHSSSGQPPAPRSLRLTFAHLGTRQWLAASSSRLPHAGPVPGRRPSPCSGLGAPLSCCALRLIDEPLPSCTLGMCGVLLVFACCFPPVALTRRPPLLLSPGSASLVPRWWPS